MNRPERLSLPANWLALLFACLLLPAGLPTAAGAGDSSAADNGPPLRLDLHWTRPRDDTPALQKRREALRTLRSKQESSLRGPSVTAPSGAVPPEAPAVAANLPGVQTVPARPALPAAPTAPALPSLSLPMPDSTEAPAAAPLPPSGGATPAVPVAKPPVQVAAMQPAPVLPANAVPWPRPRRASGGGGENMDARTALLLALLALLTAIGLAVLLARLRRKERERVFSQDFPDLAQPLAARTTRTHAHQNRLHD